MYYDRLTRLSREDAKSIINNCTVVDAYNTIAILFNRNVEKFPPLVNTAPVVDTKIIKEEEKIVPQKKQKKKKFYFYGSEEWRELRQKVLDHYGSRCMCCGIYPEPINLHVDHIKPRSVFPELSLSFDNLQVLCRDCNFTKGIEQFDYRGNAHE